MLARTGRVRWWPMPKAIVTKFFGPTNRGPAHIRAQAEGGKRPHAVCVKYDHYLGRDEAHRAAAVALCEKMSWDCGKDGSGLIEGGLPNGDTVWVFAPKMDAGELDALSHVVGIAIDDQAEYLRETGLKADYAGEEQEVAESRASTYETLAGLLDRLGLTGDADSARELAKSYRAEVADGE